ncbi:MAG: ATP-binding cassette domain-containing protein [Candidatus Peregrinibacteria bacterium]
MIRFQNISKRFGRHAVLDKVNFEIRPQEFVVLTGPSGSGKSTVVALLIGAEKPDMGYVEVDNLIVNDMDSDTLQLYRRKVGVAFQDYKLLPRKTVFENVAFAMEACDSGDEAIHRRVPEVLEKVGLLKAQDQFPEELSGGEKQRLAIARALVHFPRLLIADEPTGNLDETNARGILQLFKKLHEEGVTILITTHDPLVQKMAGGRVLTLSEGHIQ